MSHSNDSSEQQQRGRSKQRSRWNDNIYDDDDDGEIPDSDDIHPSHHQYHTTSTSVLSDTKRFRPTTAESNILETDKSHRESRRATVAAATTKQSRDELERDRQMRMAAIRAATGDLENERNDDHWRHPDSSSVTVLSKSPKTHPSTTTTTTTTSSTTASVTHSRNAAAADDDNLDPDDDNAKMMQELFGIHQFGSTKNTKVTSNHTSAANGTIAKHLKPRKYRQYMNRKNGFNRPLDNV